ATSYATAWPPRALARSSPRAPTSSTPTSGPRRRSGAPRCPSAAGSWPSPRASSTTTRTPRRRWCASPSANGPRSSPRPPAASPRSAPERPVGGTHAAWGGSAREGLAQIRDQVLGGLDPAAEAHQVGGHGGGRPLDGLVGHRLGDLDERLDAAQRLGQGEQPGARRDRRRLGMAEA